MFEVGAAVKTVLVGPPNSGKTTLYNWLTGHQAKVVNYPGSTVDYAEGVLATHWGGERLTVLDSPGAYSLFAKSEDEEVTIQLIQDLLEKKELRTVVVVIDPTQLQRHLVLALQVQEMNVPMVLALTMHDLLKKEKIVLNTKMFEDIFNCPVIQVDGRLGGGLQVLVEKLQSQKQETTQKPFQIPKMPEAQDVKSMADRLMPQQKNVLLLWSSSLKIDRWLLHPLWGYVALLLIMTGLFTSVYWVATPLMDIIESGLTWASESIEAVNPESLFLQFLSQGIVASFGAVIVFIPQIFILFFLMAILEATGYLARAATIIDRPFSKIGLSGRSFVPFLSGYACAVPALMATRNISSKREKWLARMIIPLLSCSARLPVYGLLLSLLFLDEPAWKPGLSLALLYLFSMVLATFASGWLSRILPKSTRSLFAMELPLYRWPLMKSVFFQALQKSKSFLTRAGPVIFVLSILLWTGMNFPRSSDPTLQLEQSYLGEMGKKVEPLFTPMGLDWRGGIGLLAAFAAREVFVSTLAVLYHAPEENLTDQLRQAVNSAGEIIYTPAVLVGLIFFFMIALQCLSTVGVMIKESQSWRLGFIQLFVFNALAYGIAVGIVHGLRAIGWS